MEVARYVVEELGTGDGSVDNGSNRNNNNGSTPPFRKRRLIMSLTVGTTTTNNKNSRKQPTDAVVKCFVQGHHFDTLR